MQVSFETVIQDRDGNLTDAEVEASVSTWTERGDYGSQRLAGVNSFTVYVDGLDVTATLVESDLELIAERALEAAE